MRLMILILMFLIVGCQGDPGAAGTAGKDGVDGKNGTKGDPGVSGPQGPVGQNGNDGIDANTPVSTVELCTNADGVTSHALKIGADLYYVYWYARQGDPHDAYATLVKLTPGIYAQLSDGGCEFTITADGKIE